MGNLKRVARNLEAIAEALEERGMSKIAGLVMKNAGLVTKEAGLMRKAEFADKRFADVAEKVQEVIDTAYDKFGNDSDFATGLDKALNDIVIKFNLYDKGSTNARPANLQPL